MPAERLEMRRVREILRYRAEQLGSEQELLEIVR